MILNVFLSYIIGFISGILPAYHINNTATFLYFLYSKNPLKIFYLLLFLPPSFTLGALVSALFYNVPSDEDSLYVPYILRYIFKRGIKEYVDIASLSMITSLFFLILLIPIFNKILPFLYNISLSYLKYFFILVMILYLLNDPTIKNLLMMIIASVWGYFVLDVLHLNRSFSLLPLFVGYYGMPFLLLSLFRSQSQFDVVKHKTNFKKFKLCELCVYSFCGTLIPIFASLFPAIPPLFLIPFLPIKLDSARKYIIMLSSLDISDDIFAIASQKIIGNSRSGVGEILSNISLISFKDIYLMIFVCALYIIFSNYLIFPLLLNKSIISIISSYWIKISVVLFILLLTYFTVSWIGLCVLVISTFIGYLTLKMKLTPLVLSFSLLFPLLVSMLF